MPSLAMDRWFQGVLPPEVRVPDQLGTEATVNLYNLTQYSLLFSKALAIS